MNDTCYVLGRIVPGPIEVIPCDKMAKFGFVLGGIEDLSRVSTKFLFCPFCGVEIGGDPE